MKMAFGTVSALDYFSAVGAGEGQPLLRLSPITAETVLGAQSAVSL